MSTENAQPKITTLGARAVHAAVARGVPLFVLNPQRGWIPANAARAARMAEHGMWIYGIEGEP